MDSPVNNSMQRHNKQPKKLEWDNSNKEEVPNPIHQHRAKPYVNSPPSLSNRKILSMRTIANAVSVSNPSTLATAPHDCHVHTSIIHDVSFNGWGVIPIHVQSVDMNCPRRMIHLNGGGRNG